RLAMLGGNLDQYGLLEHRSAAEWRIGLVADIVLAKIGADSTLLVFRVGLDLVDDRGHAGLVNNPLEMFGQEIGDADAPDQPILAGLDERLPGIDIVVARGSWPVDQEHVQIAELQTVQ